MEKGKQSQYTLPASASRSANMDCHIHFLLQEGYKQMHAASNIKRQLSIKFCLKAGNLEFILQAFSSLISGQNMGPGMKFGNES